MDVWNVLFAAVLPQSTLLASLFRKHRLRDDPINDAVLKSRIYQLVVVSLEFNWLGMPEGMSKRIYISSDAYLLAVPVNKSPRISPHIQRIRRLYPKLGRATLSFKYLTSFCILEGCLVKCRQRNELCDRLSFSSWDLSCADRVSR